MKSLLVVILVLVLALAACQPQMVETIVEVTRVVTETVEVEGEAIEVTRIVAAAVEGEGDAAEESGVRERVAADAPLPRLIIKNGHMTLIAADPQAAMRSAMDIMLTAGGYLVSQQVQLLDGYPYVTMQIAVPVDTFETTMDKLRALGRVEHETASGQDVTEEYVDLESRLANLRATQERLRQFLDQANNVEEVLSVNRQLSSTEEELEVILGRMTYLENRAAFSTINLILNPIVPTPTPTITPSPTPTATPTVWLPGETAARAADRLEASAKGTADVAIYSSIVLGPWLLLFALLFFIAWRIGRFVFGRAGSEPLTADGD